MRAARTLRRLLMSAAGWCSEAPISGLPTTRGPLCGEGFSTRAEAGDASLVGRHEARSTIRPFAWRILAIPVVACIASAVIACLGRRDGALQNLEMPSPLTAGAGLRAGFWWCRLSLRQHHQSEACFPAKASSSRSLYGPWSRQLPRQPPPSFPELPLPAVAAVWVRVALGVRGDRLVPDRLLDRPVLEGRIHLWVLAGRRGPRRPDHRSCPGGPSALLVPGYPGGPGVRAVPVRLARPGRLGLRAVPARPGGPVRRYFPSSRAAPASARCWPVALPAGRAGRSAQRRMLSTQSARLTFSFRPSYQ